MTMILYFSRNPNPRLAVATARHLGVDLRFEWCAPFDPAHTDFFRTLNPSRRIPILQENGNTLWEADAIACRLAQIAGSDFWRMGAQMPEMIRWISWGKANFVAACDQVHFEFGTKQRYHLGPVDQAHVAAGLASFDEHARLLDAHLAQRRWLVDDAPSYADFRMATFLPYNDVAGLPLADYRNVAAWYANLCALPAWSDPFAGLNAPLLPDVPR